MSESDDAASAARREAILAAAGRLFTREGFAATTTADVAREARISKRDLYHHFSTKQALLAAVVTHHTQPMLPPPNPPDTLDRPALLATLELFGTQFLSVYLAPHRIAYLRLAIAEAPSNAALAEALHANGTAPVAEGVRRLLRAASAGGVLAEAEIEFALEVFFSQLLAQWPLGLLLGTRAQPDAATVAAQAARAVAVLRRLLERQ